ncbi:hypothetical protein GCT13_13270 [Paraburkholderia sp. CNPSo 3157]|uniref:Phage gp6-like head-tail connector protein n=1 Tax=Paraburkholderia franconis TaxID=2654983 RepID=A0A7X1TFY1_9BURK|nr:hypothetical protein [Paraburkholderia franconis]MPW17880.1 hypothetical protein [Paraburkholderia franconis]
MGAVLVEYLDDMEPLTYEDVAAQARIDASDESSFITSIIIPGARQAAETKSGAAIRKGRYTERLPAFPVGDFPLSIGQVTEVESVSWRSASGETATLDPSSYEVIQVGRETRLAPLGSQWPRAAAVTFTYQAGTDLDKFPSVRAWMLLAAAWFYDNRELFLIAQTRQAVMEMPTGFADALLHPITVPPRF